MNKTIRARLAALRKVMKERNIDAYYVPSNDPHDSEFVSPHFQRRAFLSGFDGSAGELLITRNRAGLFTDGRYFVQAEQQLAGTGIDLFRLGEKGVATLPRFAAEILAERAIFAAAASTLSRRVANHLSRALAPKGIQLRLLEKDLVAALWTDGPGLPRAPAYVHPARYAGHSLAWKLRRLRKAMREREAEAMVLTVLDDIAWLFNLRGEDIPYNPVIIAYAIVTHADAWLFCGSEKITAQVKRHLGQNVQHMDYGRLGSLLRELGEAKMRVWVDDKRVNMGVLRHLKGADLVLRPLPVARQKAIKNSTEIEGAKKAHVRDGLAMVQFLHWLRETVPGGCVTEILAAERLREFREAQPLFRGESFESIPGYGPNGAIVHYRAREGHAATLRPRGLFLIDSGGQYLDGTTDITRTVLLGGKPSREQRALYTRVLKGHIALARARFPVGTSGRQLDSLARSPLWEISRDYAHGTGHGVGSYLNVHEGPPSVSKRSGSDAPLEPGHILSNEPGVYIEGKFGIRLENLQLVVAASEQDDSPSFLAFEALTLCPFERQLIDVSLLTKAESDWLRGYHAKVQRVLGPRLPPKVRRFLREATNLKEGS